jgi:hypothetical protein
MSTPWNNQLASLVIVSAPSGSYAGIFVYSPAPGAGTLIGSWAAQAGTDPYGNAYPQGLNVTVGTISGITFTGTNWILNSSGIFFYSGTPALGNLVTSVTQSAGTDAFGNVYQAGMTGQQLTITNASAPSAVANTSILYSSTGGRLRYINGAGVDQILTRESVNVSQFTIGTNTLPVIMSSTLTYQANEGAQSSEYEIEIDGIVTCPTGGSGGGPTLTGALFVDGVQLGAAWTVGATSFPIGGGTTNYTVRTRLAILSAGVGGTAILAAEGSFNRAATNAGNATTSNTTIGSNSGGTTKSFDTTSQHALAIFFNWGSTLNTGHGATTYRTRITRRD